MKYVAGACDAELKLGEAEVKVKQVCTDSRSVKAGDLFFAIQGEKHDGHDFVADVAAQGAAARRGGEVQVRAGMKAAGGLRGAGGGRRARRLRETGGGVSPGFDPPVTAVGGSNGKTTTKELIGRVLRQKLPTLWSEASFNNDIGVPATLLRLEKSHQAAVLEAGTNHPGELAPLVAMIQPKYGRHHQHRPRASGIFWRRGRGGAGRRLHWRNGCRRKAHCC